MNSHAKAKNHRPTADRTCPAAGGINITRKMRTALLMIREDAHYICEWQTIVRLAEAGFISYLNGRACITHEGRELLASPRALSRKPSLAKARPRDWEAVAKKYDRYG